MMRRALASSRYLIILAVLGTFVASLALLLYEIMVVAMALVDVVRSGTVSPWPSG
jgi:uncharacterized membrane protein YhaH (DUF805 family)